MIESRDEDQMTPIGHAAERGAKDVVEYFLSMVSKMLLEQLFSVES